MLRYHNITKDDMLNGDGLRTVLWLAGCEHRCEGCHNPCTWDPDGGLPFDEDAKQELFEQLKKPYISGITFTGGDPLYSGNCQGVFELMREIKEKFPDKTIWLYTGYKWEDILHYPHMPLVDVLVDGKFEKDKADPQLMWKGSTNQRVIRAKDTLRQEGPLIPMLHCGDYRRDNVKEGRPSCDK